MPERKPVIKQVVGTLQHEWRASAACLGADPEMFYTDERTELARLARAYCKSCPVQPECLNEAMVLEAQTHRYGLWGGLSPLERGKLADQRRIRRADEGGRED